MSDVLAFRARAAAYLLVHGRSNEDVLSEMVLYALEHPRAWLNVRVVYLRAMDRHNPRRGRASARRRESRRHIRLDAARPRQVTWLPATDPMLQARLRVMLAAPMRDPYSGWCLPARALRVFLAGVSGARAEDIARDEGIGRGSVWKYHSTAKAALRLLCQSLWDEWRMC